MDGKQWLIFNSLAWIVSATAVSFTGIGEIMFAPFFMTAGYLMVSEMKRLSDSDWEVTNGR
jgi:hypothetical protein